VIIFMGHYLLSSVH